MFPVGCTIRERLFAAGTSDTIEMKTQIVHTIRLLPMHEWLIKDAIDRHIIMHESYKWINLMHNVLSYL